MHQAAILGSVVWFQPEPLAPKELAIFFGRYTDKPSGTMCFAIQRLQPLSAFAGVTMHLRMSTRSKVLVVVMAEGMNGQGETKSLGIWDWNFRIRYD